MPSLSAGLLILEKPSPLFNGHDNCILLTNDKHPRYLPIAIEKESNSTANDSNTPKVS